MNSSVPLEQAIAPEQMLVELSQIDIKQLSLKGFLLLVK
jgi:hypothetical protein